MSQGLENWKGVSLRGPREMYTRSLGWGFWSFLTGQREPGGRGCIWCSCGRLIQVKVSEDSCVLTWTVGLDLMKAAGLIISPEERVYIGSEKGSWQGIREKYYLWVGWGCGPLPSPPDLLYVGSVDIQATFFCLVFVEDNLFNRSWMFVHLLWHFCSCVLRKEHCLFVGVGSSQ